MQLRFALKQTFCIKQKLLQKSMPNPVYGSERVSESLNAAVLMDTANI
ncbi:MAG: hypothetical protein JXQ82_04530 [Methanomicrobiaceae archaeon]|nr:hypothetical protein [Methanomicrobiaceae archaeon]